MNILLLGKDGQVGWELQRALAPLGNLVACNRMQADLAQPEMLQSLVLQVKPRLIVNAGAWTAVDPAETQEEKVYAINAHAPAVLARAARACHALLVHYSTDYVFDGSGSIPWKEEDVAAPLNVYGRSKLAGEQGILAQNCNHLIFRTSWVHASRGGNFAKTMRRLSMEREVLQVVDDQYGAPTGADLIADITAHAAIQALANPARQGLYHLTASGYTTWHGYACLVLEQTPGHVTQQIQAVSSQAFPSPAARPLNSRLNCHKLQSTFGLTLPPWQDGVLRMLENIKNF